MSAKRKETFLNFTKRRAMATRLCQRPSHVEVPDAVISAPEDAARAFSDVVLGAEGDPPVGEVGIAMFLDVKNRLLTTRTLEGTVDCVTIYPREIAVAALMAGAVSVVLVHNHPSGDTSFSAEDMALTRKVSAALKTLDITLHDHVVVAFGAAGLKQASMKGQGLL